MNGLLCTADRITFLLGNLTRDAGFNLYHTVRTSPELPHLRVIFEGPDTELLSDNGRALLTAISHVIFQALRLDQDNRNDCDTVHFELIHDEADISWEFARTSPGSLATAHAVAPATIARPCAAPPDRMNHACVSDTLWEELIHVRAGASFN